MKLRFKSIVIWFGVFLVATLFNTRFAYAQISQINNAGATVSANNAKTIAKDGVGNYYSVFSATYSGYSHIFVRKSEDNGATWKYWNGTGFDTTGSELPIESSGSYAQTDASIATDSNNDVHVIWRGTSAASTLKNQIRYSKFSAGSWSVETNLTAESYDQNKPSIAIDSSDNIHVTWNGKSGASTLYNQIRYIKYTQGTGWGAIVNLSSGNFNQDNSSILVDNSNNLHAVWNGTSSASGTYNQIRYSKYIEGTGWTAATNLTSGLLNQYNPSITVDQDNNLHLVWYGRTATASAYNQIRYMKYTQGTGWGTAINLTSGNYQQYNPSIAVDQDNNLNLVWLGTSLESGTYQQIRYGKYINGDWSVLLNITSGSYNLLNASIIKGASGIVWQGTTNDVGVSSSASGMMFTSPQSIFSTFPGVPTALDVADNGDGRDIQVTFTGASDETNISEYRVYVVQNHDAMQFSTNIAAGLQADQYVVESKNGNNGAHTLTLTQGLKDNNAAALVNSETYKIFVMAVGKNGYQNRISISDNTSYITLTSASAPKFSSINGVYIYSSGASNNRKVIVKDHLGNYYIVYPARYNGVLGHIFVKKSEDDGRTWKHWNGTSFDITGPEIPIESTGTLEQYSPSIEVDSNNDIHVVWNGYSTASAAALSYRQIRYTKYSGGSWSSPIDLTSENYDQGFQTMTIDNSNNIHIVWRGKSSISAGYNQIRYIKYDGSSWGTSADITSGNYNRSIPKIVSDGTSLHVVWLERVDTGYDHIIYSRYSGGSWSTPTDLTTGDYDQDYLTMTTDSDNNVHLVWIGQSSTSPIDYQVRYSKYSEGSWSTPLDLTNDSEYKEYPTISADNNNNINIAWTNESSINWIYQIRYIQYTQTGWGSPIDLTKGEYNQKDAFIEEGGYGVVWTGNTDNTATSISEDGMMFTEIGKPIPPSTKPILTDISDDGNARDIQVVFNGATDETNITEYRIYVVPSSEAASFDDETAIGLDNTRYVVEAKNGSNGNHTVTLSSTLIDTTGEKIVNGRPYNVYVMAIGQSGYTSMLSQVSEPLTLDIDGIIVYNDFSSGTLTDVVNSSGNVKLTSSSSNIDEDFEDGTYNITFTGDWLASTTTPYEGVQCFTNKAITDRQTSATQTTVVLPNGGNVSFWYRTSSETNYDKLYFYIDDVEQLGGKSGSTPWTQVTYPLTAGTHTLKWTYVKDSSGLEGEDSVYIDNISISSPQYQLTGTYLSPVIDVSSVGTARSSQISLRKDLPTNTSMLVETNISLNAGTTWSGWQTSTDAIAGIVNGLNLANGRLQYRVTLSTTDQSVTPLWKDMILSITSSGGVPAADVVAPVVTGVAEGQTYNIDVTPISADVDIASVTLTKNGSNVDSYTLGTAITQNGTYVLMVTDTSANATTINFSVNKPAATPTPTPAPAPSGSSSSSGGRSHTPSPTDTVRVVAEQVKKVVEETKIDQKDKVQDIRTKVENLAKEVLNIGDNKIAAKVDGDTIELSVDISELNEKLDNAQRLNDILEKELGATNIKRVLIEDLLKVNIDVATDKENMKVNLPVNSLINTNSNVKLQINNVVIPADALKTPEIEKEAKINSKTYLQIEVSGKEKNTVASNEKPIYSNGVIIKKKEDVGLVKVNAYIVNGEQKTPIENLKEKLIIGVNVPEALKNQDKQKLVVYTLDGKFLGGNYNPNTKRLEFKTKDLGPYRIVKEERTFNDIAQNQNKEDIEILASKHITEGISLKDYAPQMYLTRAQISTFIKRALDLDVSDYKGTFKDVEKDKWYSDSIEAVADLGIVEGVGDNKFDPDRLISNEEFITILMRAYYYLSGETEYVINANEQSQNIIDIDKASTYAKDKIQEAYIKGILEATEKNAVNPKEKVNREQASKLIVNFINALQ